MNSLAVRLFFSATVWIILTLLSAGLLLSDLNKKTNFEAFDDRLNLLLETLIGGSKVDSSDSITVVTSIGDPRFFQPYSCLLYTSPSPRDQRGSRMPSSA